MKNFAKLLINFEFLCKFALELDFNSVLMTISTDFLIAAALLAGTSLILSTIYLWWQFSRTRTIKMQAKKCAEAAGDIIHSSESRSTLPAVSVIVYSHNEAEYLRNFLPYLLNQEYPEFEIIVVNDGLSIDDSNVVAEFRSRFSNIYETFVPDDTRNVSKKKLALMVGIKAAKHDIIVVTSGHCRPSSAHWLSSMCSNFRQGTDVVIGSAVYDFSADKCRGKHYRIFDTTCTRALYTSWAIKGKPFRGTGCNLAYRRSTFFENKGFSHSMNLHYGDDDIFVNEIAHADNTHVELSAESIVTAHYPDVARALKELKFRYDFTSHFIDTHAFATEGFMTAIYWLNFAILCAIAVLASLNIASMENIDNFSLVDAALTAAAPVLLLLLTLPHIFIFRRLSALLSAPRLLFYIPIFTLLRPIVNMRYKLRGRRYRSMNFTWQRTK